MVTSTPFRTMLRGLVFLSDSSGFISGSIPDGGVGMRVGSSLCLTTGRGAVRAATESEGGTDDDGEESGGGGGVGDDENCANCCNQGD